MLTEEQRQRLLSLYPNLPKKKRTPPPEDELKVAAENKLSPTEEQLRQERIRLRQLRIREEERVRQERRIKLEMHQMRQAAIMEAEYWAKQNSRNFGAYDPIEKFEREMGCDNDR
jgi:hypothetical protein